MITATKKEPMIMNAITTSIEFGDITSYPYIAAFLMNA